MLFLDTQRRHRYHERRHLVPQTVLSIESCQAKSPGPWCGEKSGWCKSQIVPWYMIIEWLEASFSNCFDTFWYFTKTLNGQYIHPIHVYFLSIHFVQPIQHAWFFARRTSAILRDIFFWPFSILSFQGMISPLGSRLGHLLETPMCSFSCYWDMTRYPVTSWISIEEEAVSQAGTKGGWRKLVALFSNCIKHDNCKSLYTWIVSVSSLFASFCYCCGSQSRRCTQAEGCGCCGCFSVQASAFVPLEPITGEAEMCGKDGCNSEISDVRCSDFHNPFMMGYT